MTRHCLNQWRVVYTRIYESRDLSELKSVSIRQNKNISVTLSNQIHWPKIIKLLPYATRCMWLKVSWIHNWEHSFSVKSLTCVNIDLAMWDMHKIYSWVWWLLIKVINWYLLNLNTKKIPIDSQKLGLRCLFKYWMLVTGAVCFHTSISSQANPLPPVRCECYWKKRFAKLIYWFAS